MKINTEPVCGKILKEHFNEKITILEIILQVIE